ncbi:sensor histidine kinase [Archangium sp.]|jgi:signal transduction histidine kinase|uniref:sensor histidine kinase n=1 Tax=Archangium sp. TaxID=1872627 RepID=UPI00389B217C
MPRTPESRPEPGSAPHPGVWSRHTSWVLCVVIIAFTWVDTLDLGYFSPWMLGCRILWAAGMMGYTLLVDRVPASWVAPLTDVNVIISTVCILGLARGQGGIGTAYFTMVPVLPLAVSLIHRRRLRAALVSGAVGSVGTVVLARQAGLAPLQAITWVSVVMGITVLSAYFSHHAVEAQEAEEQARLERARRESLEALALSEHRRAQSEKLAIVGRLAAGVAHEINNPIAYVGSNVDFVRNELTAPREVDREELAEVLAETRVGIQHIRQVVSDLRGFARMDAHEPTPCSLADVVADAMKLASLRLKHVALRRVEVPTELPEIFVVRQRLVQVVLNLLVNAGDVLEAHRAEGGEVRVTGRCEQERVVLLVEDNGPGFAPHVLPRLFEAFFTTKGPDKGTGLGLTLSRELVEQFGGTLTASNRPEGGARLRIEFPVRRDEAAPEEEPPTEPEDGARGAA